ncbi:MAG: GGDEF domain-containing protein [Clostridia bacterium]|nr:GGDEF domain-containing protein [Clostridia bacterium]
MKLSFFKRLKEDGISLKKAYIRLVVFAVVVSCVLIFATFRSFFAFLRLSRATDEYIDLQGSVYELMEASDYLTEKVRRFTVSGELEYLNDYFREATENRRREKAVERLSEMPNAQSVIDPLKLAQQESDALMKREYYAMKLVIAAKGYSEYPEIPQDVTLSAVDLALSAEEQLRTASNMLLDEDYYDRKDFIRSNMKKSIEELKIITQEVQAKSSSALRTDIIVVCVLIVVQTAGILVMVRLTFLLGLKPVLKAVNRIKEDRPLPVIGANEFRYLARTYNKMYEVYKQSIAHLNYKASHDELTRVYNRMGYNLLLSGMELKTTVMLLIDANKFKQVNDTHGHEIGDRILQKVAKTISRYFRSDDYICRIGGDEFIVLMAHAEKLEKEMIAAKIRRINTDLANVDDGLPTVSICAGIAHGKDASDAEDLFVKADQALYQSKHDHTDCTFYGENAEQ